MEGTPLLMAGETAKRGEEEILNTIYQGELEAWRSLYSADIAGAQGQAALAQGKAAETAYDISSTTKGFTGFSSVADQLGKSAFEQYKLSKTKTTETSSPLPSGWNRYGLD